MSRSTLALAPLVLALLLAPALPAPARAQAPEAAAPRGFTAKDMVTLDRLSDPRVSPDGKYVLYSLRSTDYDANKSTTALWVLDLNDGSHAARRLLASDGGASSGRWGADGRIYFLSRRSGSTQVWRTDVSGAPAVQVTALPLDVGTFVLTPDAKRLVVSLAVYPETESGDKPAKSAGQEKTTGVVYDKLFVRHWDEWADGTRNHLFALDIDATGHARGTPLALTRGFDGDVPGKPFGDDDDIAISPDGRSVVFSARLAGTTEPWSTNFDLWQVPIDASAAPVNLTPANKAMDSGPVFSPDGTELAWRAMKRPTFEADRYAIMVRDLKTGAVREVAPAWDRSAAKIAWAADGKTLYAVAEDVGQTRLFAVNEATGAVKPLTGDGHVDAFDVAPGKGGLLYTASTLASPSQLYHLAPMGKPIQLSNVDADKLAGIAMGAYEQFSFPGWNGETVHGFVVKPANYQPGQKYPVAFLIHGGPQGSFGNLFHYRWNAQVYAGAGYGVVMIDFHGSTGYGQAFTDAISQHWGDRPLEDLQKGWAAALAKYPFLDGERACALGGSYGGFMINWIAGNWNGPWKCLVNHDGVFDNHAMGYSTEELWFSEWENGGTPWNNPEGYERYNPAKHVGQWVKPELVIQGGQDFRIPLEQGLGAFTALQRKGVPSQFLYFPDENHWVLKAQNSVQWHNTVLAWLDKWTAKP